jgi:Cyclic nucleotide-binding domain
LSSAKTRGTPISDFPRAEAPAAVGSIPECASPSTAEAFAGLIGDEYKSLAQTIFALRRGPIRYSRDQAIALEGEASEHIFLVISGVVRSFRSFQNGTRSIVAFYLPTEFFGQSFNAFVDRGSSRGCKHIIFQALRIIFYGQG